MALNYATLYMTEYSSKIPVCKKKKKTKELQFPSCL